MADDEGRSRVRPSQRKRPVKRDTINRNDPKRVRPSQRRSIIEDLKKRELERVRPSERKSLLKKKSKKDPRRQRPSLRKKFKNGLPIARILRNVPYKVRERAKHLKINERDHSIIEDNVPEMFYIVQSGTYLDLDYDTIVRYVPHKKGDHIWVHCACDDFKYRWEYALTYHQASSIINCNGNPAVITNPRNIPGCCKHLYRVLLLKSTLKTLQRLARDSKR